MGEFLAIVGDTWRQSKQQVVFIIMGVLLVLTVGTSVALPKIYDEDPENVEFGLMWMEGPTDLFEHGWITQYAQTLVIQEGSKANPFSEEGREYQRQMDEAMATARRLAHEIPPFRRSVEAWTSTTVSAIFSISMLLFIAACSSYFPGLLASGAVDVVLSKPLSRLRVFFAKYLGGLTLYAVAISLTYALLFAGIGVRTGEWIPKLFLVIPLQVFTAGVIFAMIGFLGVSFRSTALSMVIGYFFYLVIDSVIGLMQGFQQMGGMQGFEWIDRIVAGSRFVVPSFGYLKKASISPCLSIPHFDWVSLTVAAVWMGLALVLGFLKFKRTDY